MAQWKTLEAIRKDFPNFSLAEDTVNACPITQFKLWYNQIILVAHSDPRAMVLSTVDAKGIPDSRVVLLNGLEQNSFIFYTNYNSKKGVQLNCNKHAALNFYWPEMARQIRIRGRVYKTSQQQSNIYFASRPIGSQIAAMVSNQSQKIATRQQLDKLFNTLYTQHTTAVKRPKHWGGYKLIPTEIEFWQAGEHRLHDRILFYKTRGQWLHKRLAP